MSTTISAGTATSGAALSSDTSGILQLQSGSTPTTAVTIDTAQNVGVGVTPSAWGSFKVLEFPNGVMFGSYTGGVNQAYMGTNFYFNGTNFIYKQNDYAVRYEQTSGTHQWYTASSGTAGGTVSFTQAMTLDNSGNLLVTKTASSETTVGVQIINNGSIAVTSAGTNNYTYYSTSASAYRFFVDGSGTIHATSTSITAISDATLKTNIKPLETGLAEINRLQPRRFDWADQTKNVGTNIAGFISQEVQEVLPDLTPSFRYSQNEDGTDVLKLGLKMGDMIPTMVKAIQELSAQVTALSAKVTALEAKVGV